MTVDVGDFSVSHGEHVGPGEGGIVAVEQEEDLGLRCFECFLDGGPVHFVDVWLSEAAGCQ